MTNFSFPSPAATKTGLATVRSLVTVQKLHWLSQNKPLIVLFSGQVLLLESGPPGPQIPPKLILSSKWLSGQFYFICFSISTPSLPSPSAAFFSFAQKWAEPRLSVCVSIKAAGFLLMPGCQECLQLGSGFKGCVLLSLPLSHQQPVMPLHTNFVPHPHWKSDILTNTFSSWHYMQGTAYKAQMRLTVWTVKINQKWAYL